MSKWIGIALITIIGCSSVMLSPEKDTLETWRDFVLYDEGDTLLVDSLFVRLWWYGAEDTVEIAYGDIETIQDQLSQLLSVYPFLKDSLACELCIETKEKQ